MLARMLAIALVLSPLPALAQGLPSGGDGDLEQRVHQKKIIVQPRPSPETIKRDADAAVDELTAQQRSEQVVRDLNRTMPSRPDLNESVVGGIQSRNLNSVRPR